MVGRSMAVEHTSDYVELSSTNLFSGKIVLVTGAAGDIGNAIVGGLVAGGALVIGADLRPSSRFTTSQSAVSRSSVVHKYLNLGDSESINKNVCEIQESFE